VQIEPHEAGEREVALACAVEGFVVFADEGEEEADGEFGDGVGGVGGYVDGCEGEGAGGGEVDVVCACALRRRG
jgi:hypothetical protein